MISSDFLLEIKKKRKKEVNCLTLYANVKLDLKFSTSQILLFREWNSVLLSVFIKRIRLQ